MMRTPIPHGSDLAGAIRYFNTPLAEQAFMNLMAMSQEDFDGFSAVFNSRTGELGRKIETTGVK